jgi:hypothetical protein
MDDDVYNTMIIPEVAREKAIPTRVQTLLTSSGWLLLKDSVEIGKKVESNLPSVLTFGRAKGFDQLNVTWVPALPSRASTAL